MCYQRPHELYLFTLLKCYIDIEISVWHETNIILFFIAPSPAADDGKKDEELHTLQLELENLKLNLTEKESSIGRLVSINPSVVFIYFIVLIISVSVQGCSIKTYDGSLKNIYGWLA